MRGRNPRRRHTSTLGALVIALIAGCEAPPPANSLKADTASGVPPTRVVAVKPARATIRRTVEEPGQINAFETTHIHAKLSGFLKNVTVDIGSKVKEGDVMAELWMPELEAEHRQKEALVDQAEAERAQDEASVRVAQATVASADAKLVEVQAGIKRAEADLARWHSEANRVQQLVRDSVITGSLYDETRSKLQAADASLDEVRAHVKSAEAAVAESRAALEKARSDVLAASAHVEVAREDAGRVEALLAYAKIKAPFDGIVTQRYFDTGHLTQPGAATEPLFVVARSGLVTIAVDVPEMSAVAVDLGDRALISIQALEGRTFEGTVTRTAWALDPKTRTLRTEIDIPNPEGVLRPGLYAYATLVVDERSNVLSLPISAIVKEGDKAFCVCVVNGRAVRKPIRIGINDGAQAEIMSGLDGTEVVVKANASSLADGQSLEVTEVETPANTPSK
jgi:HlyD family secretion protein